MKKIILALSLIMVTGCVKTHDPVKISIDSIDQTRMYSIKSNALGYIDAIEKQVMLNDINLDEYDDIKEGTYTIDELDNKNVLFRGELPSTGCVAIDNVGSVVDYSLLYEEETKTYIVNHDSDLNDAVVRLGTKEDLKSICK